MICANRAIQIISLLCLSVTLSAPGFAAGEPADLKVATPLGPVLGVQMEHGQAFRGIPYAKAPVGELRWHAPVPYGPLTADGAFDASHAPNTCPQSLNPLGGHGWEWEIGGNEDCLFLNIYRPAVVAPAPMAVLVWIHGGGFTSDSSNTYDAEKLAADRQVIVVTLNYRLSALGLLVHPALGVDDDGTPAGNFALQDQVAALKWVRDYIAAFGGDPRNVTIAGESSGAYAVCTLVTSPKTQGLFQRAIIETGNCSYPAQEAIHGRAESEQQGTAFVASVGCDQASDVAACLRSLSPAKITAAATGPGSTWNLSYGSSLVPEPQYAAFANDRYNHVPLLVGSTHDEIRLLQLLESFTHGYLTRGGYRDEVRKKFGDRADAVLAAYPVDNYLTPRLALSTVLTDYEESCPLAKFAAQVAAKTSTFVYEFNDPHAVTRLFPDFDIPFLGAYHSSELTYLFQKPWAVGDPAQFDDGQQLLADQLGSYWTNFAKNGDPNGPGLPVWLATTPQRPYIHSLAPGGSVAADSFNTDHQCGFWP